MSDNELQKFREAWKESIKAQKENSPSDASSSTPSSSSKPTKTTTAFKESLDAYIQATRFERMGNLNAALNAYRIAEKLDADIHQKIRQNPSLVADKYSIQDSEYDTYYSLPSDPSQEASSQITREIVLTKPEFTIENNDTVFSLQAIPDEILVQIIQWVVLWDHSLIKSLALVCKKMTALTREQGIYRFLCESRHATLSIEDKQDWLHCWLHKPRIRYDGVYISRVNYVRPGLDDHLNGFNHPVHLVTYFRYLVFQSPKKCSMWMTTLEPKLAVKALHSIDTISAKGLLTGAYSMSDGILSFDLLDPNLPRHHFVGTLKVLPTRIGHFNKISWIDYYSEQLADPTTRSDVSRSHLRPFFFTMDPSELKAHNIVLKRSILDERAKSEEVLLKLVNIVLLRVLGISTSNVSQPIDGNVCEILLSYQLEFERYYASPSLLALTISQESDEWTYLCHLTQSLLHSQTQLLSKASFEWNSYILDVLRQLETFSHSNAVLFTDFKKIQSLESSEEKLADIYFDSCRNHIKKLLQQLRMGWIWKISCELNVKEDDLPFEEAFAHPLVQSFSKLSTVADSKFDFETFIREKLEHQNKKSPQASNIHSDKIQQLLIDSKQAHQLRIMSQLLHELQSTPNPSSITNENDFLEMSEDTHL